MHGKVVTNKYTIKVLTDDKQQIKIRLESIDCPERKQPFSTQAKQAVAQLCMGQSVTIYKTGTDRWQRDLAFVIVNDINLTEWLVANGLAWNYVEYSKSTELAAIETEARETGAGMWSTKSNVAPLVWRKKK